jgi:hypothetical protein
MPERPHVEFYFAIDDAITTLVVACVVMVLVMSIERGQKLVETSAAAVEIMVTHRAPISVLYALNGEWPKGLDEVQKEFPIDKGWSASPRLKNLRIEHGAVTVGLRRPLEGEWLTIRPAVISDDVLGPVRWVAGRNGHRTGWTVAGEDRTTVQDTHIPILLKR